MKGRKIKILIISNTPWAKENSFGNSYSALFEGIEDLQFANIYCKYGLPSNNIDGIYYQITEKSIIKNFFNKKNKSGQIVNFTSKYDILKKKEMDVVDIARKKRFQIYFWLRDLIWKFGNWRSTELKNFINDFNPDLIFQPLYFSSHINDIVLYSKKLTNVPMVSYVSDDVYTLKQYSLSPLYGRDRIFKRIKIRKVVDKCEFLYVISDIQKQDYEKCFNKECKVLTKGADFLTPKFKTSSNKPLKLVYTGNIGAGRWKSLAMIAETLKRINKDYLRAELIIYSPTPMTERMKQSLNVEGSVYLMGSVPSDSISEIHLDADILVHVEPLDLKGRLQVRQSFSTKIVDYFHAGRTILAIGWTKAASIDYLIREDAALVANNSESIYEKLEMILKRNIYLNEYAMKAWNCGRKNHQIGEIQTKLFKDIHLLVNNRK